MIDMNKNYRYRNGEYARILCVDSNLHAYPVISIGNDGFIVMHCADGKYSTDGCTRPLDLIEETPYIDFNTDDRVLVRSTETDEWKKRYFSHEKDGYAYCFYRGSTSWNSSDETDLWTFCKKWGETE